jgi:hypothetical protein
MRRSVPWLVALAVLTSCTSFGSTTEAPTVDAGDAAPGRTGYPAIVLADQPRLYLRLGDPAQARDEVTGSVMLFEGAAPGKTAGAIVNDPDTSYDFEGRVGVVKATPPFDFTGTQAFTLEAWVWLGTVTADFRHAVQLGDSGGASRDAVGLYVNSGAIEGLVFERWVNNTKQAVRVAPPASGAWHHVVGTYSGAQLQLFLDGALITSTADTRAHDAPLASPMVIGAKGSTFAASGWPGRLDEIAVYDKVLSSDRIAAHFKAGSAP